ncbi:replication protein [Enterococcus faecium]|nr:replication protein [Enterococcus faecium]EGP5302162.1 replication protein RepB [Enterococcus faecium]MBE9873091.1 replication protein RepB [Enterococcus faecium]NTN71288.1 replication protein [Enterococcus faecium]
MDKKKLKARHFTFVLYEESIPNDWKEQLESLGVPMAISPLHNLDKKSVETMDDEEKSIVASGGVVYKKAHYHVIYIARNPVTIESVRNKIKRKLGNSSVSHIEIIDYVKGAYEYLTHESKSAKEKNKHVYDKKDIIHINDFDLDRYVTLDESQKRELRNILTEMIDKNGITNVKELRAFVSWRGSEYGINNMNDVNDVLASNGNYFKMAFDGNYQNGFRPQYARRVNSDTGEIIEGVAKIE